MTDNCNRRTMGIQKHTDYWMKTTNGCMKERGDSMIRSNLPVLMAQRGIRTIEELKQSTGISRGTLTEIYYGKGKGVQFKTLDNLCGVLGVDVGEILKHNRTG